MSQWLHLSAVPGSMDTDGEAFSYHCLDTKAFNAGQGTKPGLHAHTLVSTGQADLDRLLGGGLPLGAVLVILEDAFSQHHNTLLK